MITSFLTGKLAVWFLETAWPFFVKYWRQIIVGAMAVWVVVCSLSHCGQPRAIVTQGETLYDTTYVVDTTWKKMLGDTVAFYEGKLSESKWERPAVTVTDAVDCEDSLADYIAAFDWALVAFDECDSSYRWDTRLRNYTKVLETDSFKLDYSIDVRGKLATQPVFKIQNKIPEKTITVTLPPLVITPRRKLFIGGGVGGQWHALQGSFRGALFKLEVSFLDKKNNQFELEGLYTTDNLGGVLFTYKKGFDVGK